VRLKLRRLCGAACNDEGIRAGQVSRWKDAPSKTSLCRNLSVNGQLWYVGWGGIPLKPRSFSPGSRHLPQQQTIIPPVGTFWQAVQLSATATSWSAGGRVNVRRGGALRRAPACAGGCGRVGLRRRAAAGAADAGSPAWFWQQAGGRVNARRGGALRRAPACAGGCGCAGAGRRAAAGAAAAGSTAWFWQQR